MFGIKLNIVLFFLLLFNVAFCMRRIKNGKMVTTEKSYVVYLVQAEPASKEYDAWLCGGAIVSSLFIITSAACVDDVKFMYAIAGYKKYVRDEQVLNDECTKATKKKVVYTCTPLKYEFDYHKVEKWSFIDIALVKVESAYNFKDTSYTTLCSYIPTTISINYEKKYQAVNTDAMVLGWGHRELWRKPEDHGNHNQETLHYASTLIMDKEICKKHYEVYPNMAKVIDQFMICTLEEGSINDRGEHQFMLNQTLLNGCSTDNKIPLSMIQQTNKSCEKEDNYHDLVIDNTRREVKKSNRTINDSLIEILNRTATINRADTKTSRKHGICQNDHGGPLVTWVGTHEVLIGVASVFKVSDQSTCMGPYLYTSTQCNGAFLDCVLTNSDLPDQNKNRRAICDSPPVLRGYDIVEKHISWTNHPHGPADNELNSPPIISRQKTINKSTNHNYNRYSNLEKFSQANMFLVRPQLPLHP